MPSKSQASHSRIEKIGTRGKLHHLIISRPESILTSNIGVGYWQEDSKLLASDERSWEIWTVTEAS